MSEQEKRCGNCAWKGPQQGPIGSRKISDLLCVCFAPLPISTAPNARKNMILPNEGAGCPCFKPREEKKK